MSTSKPSEGVFGLPHTCDEDYWYPHTYKAYDGECETVEQVYDCIDLYISKDVSTADFEAIKFIVFQKFCYLDYVLKKYSIVDYDHLVATCIINKCPNVFLLAILQAHERQHGSVYVADPYYNDILYLSFDCRNQQALLILCKAGCVPDHYLALVGSEVSFEDAKARLLLWDRYDPTNPRNLVYALKEQDVHLANHLILSGACVDVWNNYPMTLCLKDPVLKSFGGLMQAMFKHGAKIPLRTLQQKRDQREATNIVTKILVALNKSNS